MNWEVFFDGIGTEIISLIIGGIIGGFSGYFIGVRKSSRQKQNAGDKANQRQESHINDLNVSSDSKRNKKQDVLKQNQKAGDESKQVQIGGINDKR